MTEVVQPCILHKASIRQWQLSFLQEDIHSGTAMSTQPGHHPMKAWLKASWGVRVSRQQDSYIRKSAGLSRHSSLCYQGILLPQHNLRFPQDLAGTLASGVGTTTWNPIILTTLTAGCGSGFRSNSSCLGGLCVGPAGATRSVTDEPAGPRNSVVVSSSVRLSQGMLSANSTSNRSAEDRL